MNRLAVLKKVLFLMEEEIKHIQKKCFFIESRIKELIKKKQLLKDYLVEYQEKISKETETIKASHYKQQCYFISQLSEALSQQEKAIHHEKSVLNQVVRMFQSKEDKANKIKEMIDKNEQILRIHAVRRESQKDTDLFNHITTIALKENSSNTD